MDRRTLIGGTTAAALLAVTSGPALAAALPIVVFGDSFSQVPRANFPNWVTQLEQAGRVRVVRNFAKSGATAATIGTNHFARQLRLWRAAGRPVGQRVIGPAPLEWRGGIRRSCGFEHGDPCHAGARLGRGAIAQG